MKKNKPKHMAALLTLILCLALFTATAAAAEVQSGELPVTINLEGSLPEVDEAYTIVMKADNPAYPMPEGSKNGLFSMVVTGADTAKLPGIRFPSLGIYTYTIFQEAGTNELAVYDDSAYNLVVYVTNNESGSGLETTILLYLLGETEKYEEVAFNNNYAQVIIIDPEPPQVDPGEEELPRTGGMPAGIFLAAGAAMIIAGVKLKRKEKLNTAK